MRRISWTVEALAMGSQRSRLLALAMLVSLILPAAPSSGTIVNCPDAPPLPTYVIKFETFGNVSPAVQNCSDGFFCHQAEDSPHFIEVVGGCNPQVGPCTIRARVPLLFPGMAQNDAIFLGSAVVYWFDTSDPPDSCEPWSNVECGQIGACGNPALGGVIRTDLIETWIELGGVSCSALNNPQFHPYSVLAVSCNATSSCHQRHFVPGIDLSPFALGLELGCFGPPPPLKSGCHDQSCNSCFAGTNTGGGGAAWGAGGRDTGPQAVLRYTAGGVGAIKQPGTAAINVELGRGWMHDYAMRLVADPDPSHVWLLTPTATFREFTDASSDGVYELVSPSDEHRELTYSAATGWQLTALDGTVDAFNLAGRWVSSTDRFGNATTATYNGAAQLTTVNKPDGRSEAFTYNGKGKLSKITEIGVGGAASRSWFYDWSGLDLFQIWRPDNTKLEFFYEDNRYPGYLTRVDWVSTQGGSNPARRILRRFEYDAFGNAIRSWSGDASFNGANAVDRWELSFDDPSLPTLTQVTDPLGQIITVDVGRDVGSSKPRIEGISGDCSVCSTPPNTTFQFSDPEHPLLPTQIIDGNGNVTLLTYTSDGPVASRTEAFGTALERTTEWSYSPTFPALVTSVRRPSTSGAGLRMQSLGYNSAGALTSTQEEGVENSSAFLYTTVTVPTAEGQPESIDPPGYGTTDQTTFTYDPARGGLLPLTRTDPLVGTTTFAYDPFNYPSSVSRQNLPNNETTTTVYDPMSRPTERRQLGDVPANDLRTRHFYDLFGDLVCTVLPQGNAVQFLYDFAGRLVEQRRGLAVSSPSATNCLNTMLARERTVYGLNGAGQRVLEKRERSTGATTWATEAETAFVYASRCHLQQVIAAPGRPEEAVAEYAYDCNGQLERVWDANHPSAGQSAPAAQVYQYDALNRLSAVTQPWTGGGAAQTLYGYDVQDHLEAVTDAEGNLTSYTTSDRDLMTSETSPVSGLTSHIYNEHGELVSTTDARPVTMTLLVDAADRVTLMDYPGTELDIAYLYDDPLVPQALGRLTKISRGNTVLDYRYDRFGRTTQDGALTMTYDRNGNALTLVYPGSVTAAYTFDFADREASLVIQRPGETNQTLVSAATYRPFGPLSTATLGNSRTETRSFDFRYQPTGIQLSAGLLDWAYTTDDVGNVTAINDQTAANQDRTFGYQDFAYFLTQGDGPWGDRSWTYDKIGNRLTETQSGLTDTYTYGSSGTGHTPKLMQVDLGSSGSRTYTYLPSGHVSQVAAPGNTVTFTTNDAARTSRVERSAELFTNFTYDGRDFLSSAAGELPPPDLPLVVREASGTLLFADGFESGDACEWTSITGPITPLCPGPTLISATPTYTSDGVLRRLLRSGSTVGVEEIQYFYFAGRPITQLELDGGNDTFKWLTTDHLGTPVVATSDIGALLWGGGLEPFGKDFNGASAAGMQLRLPGQWFDESWEQSSLGAEVYYNLHRWYETQTARYTKLDPLADIPVTDLRDPLNLDPELFSPLYLYAGSSPTNFIDPLGLLRFKGCSAQDTATTKEAFKDYCQRIEGQEFVDCMCGSPSTPPALKKLCADPKLTVRCKEGTARMCQGNCAYAVPHGRTIRLCPATFDEEGGCGPVGCTLIHEMTHQVGHGGEVVPRFAEKCLGCP